MTWTYFAALNAAVAHLFTKPAVTASATDQLDWWCEHADLWRAVARTADPLTGERAYDLADLAETEAARFADAIPTTPWAA
jgi:hypothetical protein